MTLLVHDRHYFVVDVGLDRRVPALHDIGRSGTGWQAVAALNLLAEDDRSLGADGALLELRIKNLLTQARPQLVTVAEPWRGVLGE